jgi:hypothetical protein
MKNILLLFAIAFSFDSFAQIPTTGLIGYYPFSGNVNDYSGNNNSGTNNGATLTTDRFGNANAAYSFNGTSNYIDLSSHVSAFNFQQPMAISFWFKSNQDVGSAIFSISDGSTGATASTVFTGNVTGTLTDEMVTVSHQLNSTDRYIAGFTTTKRDTLIDNNWHHIVVEFNNSQTMIYLDNDSIGLICNYGVNNGHYGNVPGATKVFIGTRWANNTPGVFMNGALDDIRIYGKSLNKQEVNALFNEGMCYQTISVTDTLIINANLTGFAPLSYSNTLKIYPNPAKDHLLINTMSNNNGNKIKIINTLSQVVFQTTISQQLYNIDLNSWTGNGTYFVQFYDVNDILMDVRKIIIQ